MKSLFLSILFALSFGISAHASENNLTNLPINLQGAAITSSVEQNDAQIESTSHYCCIREGGNYCDMGYSDTFGQPCECHTGDQIWHGHVCR